MHNRSCRKIFPGIRAGNALSVDISLFVFIVFIDQMIKIAVQSFMIPGESIPVIPGIFHCTYVLNPGAAFGILEHQREFFIAAGVLLLGGALRFYPGIRKMGAWLRYGTLMLLGGAAGNLIDRIVSGFVVDFLDFRFWPVFNLADIAIVIGVGCMIYGILLQDDSEQEENNS